jgi:hypothetical protein
MPIFRDIRRISSDDDTILSTLDPCFRLGRRQWRVGNANMNKAREKDGISIVGGVELALKQT